MPSRIIRESALTSRSLDKLSDGAERMFWRLTLVADDHGRFDASPQVLKAKCFPLKVDTLKTPTIASWRQELAAGDHVRLYVVGGREYGHFPGWTAYQRPNRYKSRFPDPPADSGCNPLQSADSGSNQAIADLISSEKREEISDKREEISEPRRLQRRKHTYPSDFAVSEEMREWAKKEQTPNPDLQLEAFRDHHIAKASLFVDWEAALRTWLRNAKRFGANGKGKADKDEAHRLRMTAILNQGLSKEGAA